MIVSSPTNLFALLKLVDDLWKRDKQNKNAIAIATEGANLYDKFVGFAETLTDLGRSVSAAGGEIRTGDQTIENRQRQPDPAYRAVA